MQFSFSAPGTHNCKECGMEFKDRRYVRDHYYRTHMEYSQWPHTCDLEGCAYRFFDKSSLNKHAVICSKLSPTERTAKQPKTLVMRNELPKKGKPKTAAASLSSSSTSASSSNRDGPTVRSFGYYSLKSKILHRKADCAAINNEEIVRCPRNPNMTVCDICYLGYKSQKTPSPKAPTHKRKRTIE